jgi:hypothetical protein
MKRLLVAATCLALAAPVFAAKNPRVPPHAPSGGAPATVTIGGSPLTIVIGGDTSMQVYNSNVPGQGQFYPPGCAPGQTADSGVFVAMGPVIYGPDFNNHPCGSAANAYTPWVQQSLSAVSGTGSAGDPFTVTIGVAAGATNLRLTETVTYVNGDPRANIQLAFFELPPAGAPEAPQGDLLFDAFIGADLYLADNDSGFGVLQGGSVGGRAADASCLPLQYVILFEANTAASRYVAEAYDTVWNQISAANLSNTVSPACDDNGAALQWSGLVVSGPTTAIVNTGVSFTGNAQALATVPTLSTVGLAALILLLAVVGYVLARKTSLGA